MPRFCLKTHLTAVELLTPSADMQYHRSHPVLSHAGQTRSAGKARMWPQWGQSTETPHKHLWSKVGTDLKHLTEKIAPCWTWLKFCEMAETGNTSGRNVILRHLDFWIFIYLFGSLWISRGAEDNNVRDLGGSVQYLRLIPNDARSMRWKGIFNSRTWKKNSLCCHRGPELPMRASWGALVWHCEDLAEICHL